MAQPDNPVSPNRAIQILRGVIGEDFTWPASIPKPVDLTRGQAAMLILEAVEWVSQKNMASQKLPDFRKLNGGLHSGPIVIDHRGGVIAPDAPECSLKAIERAAL
ncbi:MAG: hypothetical protein ACO3VS_07945, partial [Limisphaerales bacterium]